MTFLKRILSFFFSSGITLSLWFYFDHLTDKIQGIFFPKKMVLKETYKLLERNPLPIPKETKQSFVDYILWGDLGFKERLKIDGLWKTIKSGYGLDTSSTFISSQEVQNITHKTVLETDTMIKDNAIKSATHVQGVLSDYFQNNMSWIDFLIIQGFKGLLLVIFCLLVYGLLRLILKTLTK